MSKTSKKTAPHAAPAAAPAPPVEEIAPEAPPLAPREAPPEFLASFELDEQVAAHKALSEYQGIWPRAECRENWGNSRKIEIWSGPNVPQAEEATG